MFFSVRKDLFRSTQQRFVEMVVPVRLGRRHFAIFFSIFVVIIVFYQLTVYNEERITSWRNSVKGSNSATPPPSPEFIELNINNIKKGGEIPISNSYESLEVWRIPDSFTPAYSNDNKNTQQKSSFENINGRPKAPPASTFSNTADYLKTPLIADYAPNADKVFLMIKTGASVLWERLPIHLFTTLTRVPNFALYSDAPGSIGGYEVIDILANVSSESRSTDAFKMYRNQITLHDTHANVPLTDVDGKDGWNLDKFKNIPMLAHAWSVSPESDWFVFMDADSYLLLDGLFEYLSTLDPNEPLYMGNRAGLYEIKFAHGGSGVILSRRTMQDSIGQNPVDIPIHYENQTFKECCGDYMVANMVLDLTEVRMTENLGFNREAYYHSENLAERVWCEPVYSFHHLDPHDIEVLYEYERIRRLEGKGKSILYADIYRDFILPYIDHRIENWDNLATKEVYSLDRDVKKGIKPSTDGGSEVRPYESIEACEKYCKDKSNCLSFRYHKSKNECAAADYIRLGKPAFDFQKSAKNTKDGIISGWMIDRIQEFRNRTTCDSFKLPDSLDAEIDRNEGWYRRTDPTVIKGPYL